MAFHHVALATKDLPATHEFYTEVMGFELAKMVVGPTPEGGWAKHVFYQTGGDGMIAFWEIHDDKLGQFPTDLNRGIGLPTWVNHLAFDAPDLAAFDACRQRWRQHGYTVLELDHGFCRSIYIEDPNGITVEWCCTLRPFTDEDRMSAVARIISDDPTPNEPAPAAAIHEPLTPATV